MGDITSLHRIALDTSVESSLLTEIGYESGVLAVRFRSGGVYQYHGVEPVIFQELQEALSPGQYFNMNIKGKYLGVRMTGTCPACGARHGWIGARCETCQGAEYQYENVKPRRRGSA